MKKITRFNGEYRFLSNFYDAPLVVGDITYPTVEHAYQAAKSLDIEDRLYAAHGRLRASEVKHWGQGTKLRPDWESVKESIMLELLRTKFARGTLLAEKLLATGDAELIKGNIWHDSYWGVCSCPGCPSGKNRIGILLMQVRQELRA